MGAVAAVAFGRQDWPDLSFKKSRIGGLRQQGHREQRNQKLEATHSECWLHCLPVAGGIQRPSGRAISVTGNEIPRQTRARKISQPVTEIGVNVRRGRPASAAVPAGGGGKCQLAGPKDGGLAYTGGDLTHILGPGHAGK